MLLVSELPFASTLVTLEAHRAARGLFKSRPTIFAGDHEGKDYPSRLVRALVPDGMPILAGDGCRRTFRGCRGECRGLRCPECGTFGPVAGIVGP